MADATSETAVLWGTAEDGHRDGRELVIMMHGRGGKESDLFGLARFFLPESTVVASLRAPNVYGSGYAWYSEDPQAELAASVAGVLAWLDGLSFTPAGVGLMGFSQGARMALQLLRQAPGRFRYALPLSGAVAEGEHPGDAALAAATPRVPVFWGHGDADEAIAPESIEHTRAWLGEHTRAEEHVYPMGHTIAQDELADLKRFVAAQH
ncbi:dienelactone hydrolase family protein [Parafrigoribacterium mesophilum]|uniref:alpha/beta hydrolase n=1 Tax=Parafrigoribacterium mesophilum TaxID=433646 RepID=UPI0031FE0E19